MDHRVPVPRLSRGLGILLAAWAPAWTGQTDSVVVDSTIRVPPSSDSSVSGDSPAPAEVLPEVQDSTIPVQSPQGPVDAQAVVPASDTVRTLRATEAGRTVVVKGAKPAPVSKVPIRLAHQLPSIAGEPDVMRAALRSPSVAGSSDFSNKLYVRGSSADQNLVLFDDAIVWSPSHFGGMMSTFVVDGLSDMSMYPGGFDARWGNRLASVLDVRTKNPGAIRDTCCVDGMFRWSNFAFSLELERRVGHWWIVAAGRYTYFDRMFTLLRRLDLMDLQLDYRFYDIQTGLGWTDGRDTVRASVYAGRDDMDDGPVHIDWGNYAVPLNWSKALADDFRARGSLSWSWFDQTYTVADLETMGNSVQDLKMRQELTWNAPWNALVAAGGEATRIESRLTSRDLTTGAVESAKPDPVWIWEPYVSHDWRLPGGWNLALGVRETWNPRFEDPTFDGRATLGWTPDRDWRFEAHAGTYSQYMTSLRFDEAEQPNEFWYPLLPPAKPSRQFLVALGGQRSNLPLGLQARLDLYGKQMRDIPYFFPNSGTVREAQDESDWFNRNLVMLRGWAAGGEASLTREAGPVAGSVSYAWGMSVVKQPAFDGPGGRVEFAPRWAPWDQRHRLKLDLTTEWLGRGRAVWNTSKDRSLRSSASLSWSTGMAWTEPVGWVKGASPLQESDGEGGWGDGEASWIVWGDAGAGHKPDYFRLDLVPLDLRIGSDRWYWSMINVTDHDNLILRKWKSKTAPPTYKDTDGYGFFPIMFGYERKF